MFVVLSGKVRLDLGVDSAVGRTCGQGALVGLPSTLTRQHYSMTATVTGMPNSAFGVLTHWVLYCVRILISASRYW